MDLGIQSVIELEVLMAVMAQEGQSQGELGAIVELEQNRMANVIPRLRTKNLVDDYVVTGRTKAIDLTAKSRRLRDTL
jgi:DNA-binding MarR family transcriptional regulator